MIKDLGGVSTASTSEQRANRFICVDASFKRFDHDLWQ